LGPKDLAKNETRAVRRDTGLSTQLSLSALVSDVQSIMTQMQSEMFARAKAVRDERLVTLETWDKFVETLNNKCLILAPWCEQTCCEDAVKERSARRYTPLL
jgi:prolyl-tRNA synthetase